MNRNVKYSKERYKGLNYVEEELARSIDSLVEEAKKKLNISIVYFNNPKKTKVVRFGFFPHISDGTSSSISSWKQVSGRKMVLLKKMLERGEFYGFKNIKGQSCKVKLKAKR
jgi:hypothetical protein